jgi:hypothetical protein
LISTKASFDDEEERKKKKKVVNDLSISNNLVKQEIVEEKCEKIEIKKQKNVFNLVNMIANEISSIQVDNRQEKSIENASIQNIDQAVNNVQLEKQKTNEDEQQEVVYETHDYKMDSTYTENSELLNTQSSMVHSEVIIKTPSERIRQFSIKNDNLNKEEDIISSIIQEKRFINQTISENEEFIQSQQRYIQSEEIINTEAQGICESSEITLADKTQQQEKEASLGEQVKIMGTSTNSLLSKNYLKNKDKLNYSSY